jgi:O-acetyl-ADP-ribose deacetylase (regulator of RNase III)
MLKVIKGDLLESKEKYIVHQTNCCSTGAGGLAYYLFKKFPYADVYSCRDRSMHLGWSTDEIGSRPAVEHDQPGTIIIRGNGKDQRYVVGVMGQYYPGGPGYGKHRDIDGPIVRQRYFHQALWELAQIENLESVAFPYGIGCGLAAGDWEVYFKILNNFADYLSGKVDVVIYQKD